MGGYHAIAGWKPEDGLWERILPIYYVDYRDQTLVISLDYNHPYPQSHLTGPEAF